MTLGVFYGLRRVRRARVYEPETGDGKLETGKSRGRDTKDSLGLLGRDLSATSTLGRDVADTLVQESYLLPQPRPQGFSQVHIGPTGHPFRFSFCGWRTLFTKGTPPKARG